MQIAGDLAVIGGGLAGVCCAITAARAGAKVVLIQDRPVLGGNASSEVRLWILGATSHMGNNNRWAREGGVIDEILGENMFRNPEGNPVIVDTILLEKVAAEPNITLLLNTVVHDLETWHGLPAHEPRPAGNPDSWAGSPCHSIKSVRAFCSQNSTVYEVTAPLFCDASGDGIVGFLAGAAFRIGAEGRDEFGEKFAPPQATNELLGHTIYFFSKDTGRPVKFIPPSFALKDITQIPRWRDIKAGDQGGYLWWLEWGGRLDTIHDSETIKWELWKVAYGVWNHIKNSGQFPQAGTMTLEWVGMIPGKRESRRFEGDYMLIQQDIVEQRRHADAVSFGGWAIDLHPVDGVFSDKPGCVQWHSKGVYEIPYRCLYSRNITNLFLAGRIISASHVAFGSARVMATCAHGGQAVGMAAALCARHGLKPRELGARMPELQRELLRAGQYIPGVALDDPADLAQRATIEATSELKLALFPPNGETLPLANAWAMMLPVQPGPMPRVEFMVDVAQPTELVAELRVSSKPGNHTPDVTLATLKLPLRIGAKQRLQLDFGGSGMGFQPMNDHGSTFQAGKDESRFHGQDAHATDIRVRQGSYLPHWELSGATYAVTFRLGDSLPQSVLESWLGERENLIATARQQGRPLSDAELRRLAELHSEKVEAYLDAAHGACWLRQEAVAEMVAGALRHFDGSRYRLHAWCVMPNHVHAVLTPLGEHTLSQILHSWKSFTANQANKLLERNGPFWQEESYDHLVRDEQDFAHCVDYILENPAKAGLRDWKWVSGLAFQAMNQQRPETHGLEARVTPTVHGQDAHATASRYAFVCLMANEHVAVHLSDKRVTGVLAVTQKFNRAVAKSPRQEPPPDSGIDSFEFWIPQRRPGGKNFAMIIEPPLEVFQAANAVNGITRPTNQPNAWVADFTDTAPTLTLCWAKPQTIRRIELGFDTDFDHPMESVLMGHPERVMPFCVRQFEVCDGVGRVLYRCEENHQTRCTVRLSQPATTDRLSFHLTAPETGVPSALFEVRCYES